MAPVLLCNWYHLSVPLARSLAYVIVFNGISAHPSLSSKGNRDLKSSILLRAAKLNTAYQNKLRHSKTFSLHFIKISPVWPIYHMGYQNTKSWCLVAFLRHGRDCVPSVHLKSACFSQFKWNVKSWFHETLLALEIFWSSSTFRFRFLRTIRY